MYSKQYVRLKKVKAKSHESQRWVRRFSDNRSPPLPPHPSRSLSALLHRPRKAAAGPGGQPAPSPGPAPSLGAPSTRKLLAGHELSRASPILGKYTTFGGTPWLVSKAKQTPSFKELGFPSWTHTWVPPPPRGLAACLALECALPGEVLGLPAFRSHREYRNRVVLNAALFLQIL